MVSAKEKSTHTKVLHVSTAPRILTLATTSMRQNFPLYVGWRCVAGENEGFVKRNETATKVMSSAQEERGVTLSSLAALLSITSHKHLHDGER